ncbi:TPA: hypothetical protein DCQ19_03410 [Candidatus Shapirobacteria bacterium]|nr:hypothetical protein [Candidatus Shapirobacteria bacterium]
MMLSWIKRNWDKIILWGMVAGYGLLMSFLAIRRHNAFFSGYDLANMDQTIWNTIRGGNFFQLSGADGLVSRFQYHGDLILVILSPIYLIWNDVRALLTVQSVFIGLAAIPIYLIAFRILKNKLIALLIAGVYLINPGVMWTNMYDFHGESLAMFLVLMTFYWGLVKEWNWMYLAALLAMTTKENVPLVIGVIGLILFLVYKERAKGMILMILGAIWFVVVVFVVMPYFSGGQQHWVWGWYDSVETVEQSSWTKYIWNFTNSEKLKYYDDLLKPWGYLPILGIPWLIMAGPQLAINLLSSQGQMKSIVMHYDSMIIPGIVLALIFGFKYLQVITTKFKVNKNVFLYLLSILMIFFAARQNYHYSPLPTTPSHWWPMYRVGVDEIDFEKELKKIPADASITASSEVRTHLTHREFATNLPHGVGEVDYIAMVDHNHLVGDVEVKPFEGELIRKIQSGEEVRYKEIYHRGEYWLFKKVYSE